MLSIFMIFMPNLGNCKIVQNGEKTITKTQAMRNEIIKALKYKN